MSLIREVIDQVRAVVEALEDIRTRIRAAYRVFGETALNLFMVLKGTTHAGAPTIIDELATAMAYLAEIDRSLNSSETRLNDWCTRIAPGIPLGVDITPTVHEEPPPRLIAANTTDRRPAASDLSPVGVPVLIEPVGKDSPVPGYVAKAAPELPIRRSEDAKTTGIAFDRTGQRLTDQPIWSGHDGPGKGGPYLRRDDPIERWWLLASAVDHVEGHTAALMRRPGGPKDVVLIINNEPCRKRKGCARMLPGFLPRGAQLHIYLAQSDGTVTFHGTYHGHGRGVTQ